MRPKPTEVVRGFEFYREFIDPAAQKALSEDLRDVARKAPFVRPVTPWGRPMSVRMTSAGQFGWVIGKAGYAYTETDRRGQRWPRMPEALTILWTRLVPDARPPECCLVNFYGEGARMGLHQDRDEADFAQPVLSLSLGDEALFRMGNPTRGGPTQSAWLRSGDVVVMAGAARRAYHGIDRIRFGSSDLLPGGGRINVTLRVVT